MFSHCAVVCFCVCMCACLTPGAVTMATRTLKFGMVTPLVIIWKVLFQIFEFLFFLLSYAPFSIFPYIFSVILMQYCGKSENDRTIKSCIRIYIQEMKKIKIFFFQTSIFWRVMAPWFLGFLIAITREPIVRFVWSWSLSSVIFGQ